MQKQIKSTDIPIEQAALCLRCVQSGTAYDPVYDTIAQKIEDVDDGWIVHLFVKQPDSSHRRIRLLVPKTIPMQEM